MNLTWWIVVGLMWAGSVVVVIQMARHAERFCICRCEHRRCSKLIDGDDMLCGFCRELGEMQVPHCHVFAQGLNGQNGQIIMMHNPNRRAQGA